jgi:enamine deaminase RidA (YjgF/YER057c/UK114 family)
MKGVLAQRGPAVITVQTIFLRHAADQPEAEQILAEEFGKEWPVTNFVVQPPCCGAALAVEAWAIGGESVKVERFGRQTMAVGYQGLRWVHCGGVEPARVIQEPYRQAADGFEQMKRLLAKAGTGFERVVRTWLYVGGITGDERHLCNRFEAERAAAFPWDYGAEVERSRYQELNRARSDFYDGVRFARQENFYPASTGIGMNGSGMVMSCLALDTQREDVFRLALENPLQTPAPSYPPRYSRQSPKFSRAMALVVGDYVTTWVSGTASIVNSESCHPGNIEAQTEQTIDNIELLIGPENFARHGVERAGARMGDLAKIRVYLKRPEDLARCRAVCERRFGSVPALYLVADICRRELLVEIEGVAFSECPGSAGVSPADSAGNKAQHAGQRPALSGL